MQETKRRVRKTILCLLHENSNTIYSNLKWYFKRINVLNFLIDMLTKLQYNVTTEKQSDEDYIEICACNMDLCNSYVSFSSGASSTSPTYPPISKITSNEYQLFGSSSSASYISSNQPTQFNYIIELVNSAVM